MAQIDYVLIDGLAVGAHGAVRATGDVDICPNPDDSNLLRLTHLLSEFDAYGLQAHGFESLRGGGNFRFRTRLGHLGVTQHVAPFADRSWEILDRRAETRRAFGHAVRVCSYEDLVEMKQAAGRDQDRIDIEDLKAARREL